MVSTATSPGSWRESTKSRKTMAMIEVTRLLCQPTRILVIGCGNGREAGLFARAFNAEAVGIDVGQTFQFDVEGSAPAQLFDMDARELTFPDASFDFVYSFHALEHIPGPKVALREAARVLKPGGHFLFGTPNKRRFLGYVGSARSLGDKVRYNWADWKKRFKGQWSNEAGAHAGFTERELSDLTREAFGSSKVLSDEYYRRLYKPALVQTLSSTGLKQVAYPCVYVGGQRL